MAEDDAEKAFFQAQAMNAESLDHNDAEGRHANGSDFVENVTLLENDVAPQEDPSANQHIPSETPQLQPQASLPQGADPSQHADSAGPSEPPSRTESQTPISAPATGASVQPKTRTIGGFVVEDEDEDDTGDADYEPPAVLGVEDMNTIPSQPIPGNANEATSTPDVSFDEAAQGPASATNVPNSSLSSGSLPFKNDGFMNQGQNLYNSRASLQPDTAQESATATPTPDSSIAAKGRLPHDRVGILEDRIQEDPRGDISAWLELIDEHRGRNRIDSARDAFERFLQVFPLSVSRAVSLSVLLNILTSSGRNVGGVCDYGV